uniref:Uncharacterized protein n=1 Tax=Lygus hesperus TaxID=30085 RepID=A0A0A9XR16_LYGHE
MIIIQEDSIQSPNLILTNLLSPPPEVVASLSTVESVCRCCFLTEHLAGRTRQRLSLSVKLNCCYQQLFGLQNTPGRPGKKCLTSGVGDVIIINFMTIFRSWDAPHVAPLGKLSIRSIIRKWRE